MKNFYNNKKLKPFTKYIAIYIGQLDINLNLWQIGGIRAVTQENIYLEI